MFQGKDDNSQNLPERDENAILQTYLKADDSLEGKIPCLIRGFIYETTYQAWYFSLQTYLKADDSLEGKIPCLIRGFIYVYKLSIDLLVDRGTLHTSAVSSRMKHLCASAASFRCLGYYHQNKGNKRRKDCLNLQHSRSSANNAIKLRSRNGSVASTAPVDNIDKCSASD